MTDLATHSIASWDETFRLVLSDLEQPGAWSLLGRCRAVPVNVFFPERGDNRAVTRAKEICSRCPVLEECRAYAVTAPQELTGIWGGLSGKERREWRRRPPVEADAAPPESTRTKRAYKGSLYRQLEKLTAHPGRWARVVRYPSKGSAASQASVMRTGRATLPDGRWEFEGRVNDEGGSDLYARYLGPQEASA